jgi:asparagine synthase (glutamine-hydrolysing)
MCGICGIVRWDWPADPAVCRKRVAAMVEAMAHRGPDGEGVSVGDGAVLGAARLAIRGGDDGRQPMRDEASGVVVVCNGEIDNHRELKEWLASHGRPVGAATDIAVIGPLYVALGEEFVERLVGAFALAIWDPRNQSLLLARDRAGERPLHYTREAAGVRFASEIAVLAVDAEQPLPVDKEALHGYLRSGYLAAPATPFCEIRKVRPAELVRIERQGLRCRSYWRWGVLSAAKAAPGVDQFDHVFREAVRRQSEVDVPYGVFLSGGVDSSLVAALARQVRPEYRLRAYALRFREPSYDEGGYAESVAEALGIELESVWVTPESFPAEISDLVAHAGEPLADPAWVPTALLSRRAAADVKIALVGEGGDEIFGGYPTYLGAQVRKAYDRWPALLKAIFRRGVERWPAADKKVALSFLLKKFVQGEKLDGIGRHLLWTSSIAPETLAALGVTGAEAPPQEAEPGALLDLLQRHDLENSLAEGLLTKADRASMRYAVELRAPFLDQGVMDFAAGLPVWERVRGFETKVFLKRYALLYLPRAIVNRRKRGLSVPLSRWLREPLYEWAKSCLQREGLETVGVNRRAALALLHDHRQRKADHSRALWNLIVLSEWLKWQQSPPGGERETATAPGKGLLARPQ